MKTMTIKKLKEISDELFGINTHISTNPNTHQIYVFNESTREMLLFMNLTESDNHDNCHIHGVFLPTIGLYNIVDIARFITQLDDVEFKLLVDNESNYHYPVVFEDVMYELYGDERVNNTLPLTPEHDHYSLVNQVSMFFDLIGSKGTLKTKGLIKSTEHLKEYIKYSLNDKINVKYVGYVSKIASENYYLQLSDTDGNEFVRIMLDTFEVDSDRLIGANIGYFITDNFTFTDMETLTNRGISFLIDRLKFVTPKDLESIDINQSQEDEKLTRLETIETSIQDMLEKYGTIEALEKGILKSIEDGDINIQTELLNELLDASYGISEYTGTDTISVEGFNVDIRTNSLFRINVDIDITDESEMTPEEYDYAYDVITGSIDLSKDSPFDKNNKNGKDNQTKDNQNNFNDIDIDDFDGEDIDFDD